MDGATQRSRNLVSERGGRKAVSPARPANLLIPRLEKEKESDGMMGSQKLDAASLGMTRATKIEDCCVDR